MRPTLAALLALALLAGCAGPASVQETAAPTSLQFDDGDATRVDVPRLPSSPPAPGERTLDEVPQWRLGEYWDYEVRDAFRGETISIRRVVAGTFGPSYLVGFPLDAFSNDALILHVPGYGDVDQTDLSFDVHDADFKALDFPLVAGKTWPTAFEGRPGNATVLEAAAGQATIRVTDNATYDWLAVYDAEAGDLVSLSDPGYATVTLVAHGYGHAGPVRVPHAHDLIFQHGRVGPWALGQDPAQDPAPAPASDTVSVPAGYDRLAFTLIVGGGPNLLVPGLPALPSSGSYRERVTSPNGTVFEVAMGPTEDGLRIHFFGAGDPTGDWLLEHEAHGPGIALAEGIGYHSVDIDLPSGCVLPGPNASHHVAPCFADTAA